MDINFQDKVIMKIIKFKRIDIVVMIKLMKFKRIDIVIMMKIIKFKRIKELNYENILYKNCKKITYYKNNKFIYIYFINNRQFL